MGLFTVRVELHNATWPTDYQTLHIAMTKAGFSNLVKADSGVVYQLPTAEYNSEGNYTIQQIQNAANNAASSVGRRYAVLVTEGVKRLWTGLQPVMQHH